MNTDDRTRLMRLICSFRPSWDSAGVADAIKTVELRYPGDNFRVAVHCLTQAAKASNEKPVAMTWDLPEPSGEWTRREAEAPYCQTHPKSAPRPSGECSGCFIDKAVEQRESVPSPPVFVPRPLPQNLNQLKEQVKAKISNGMER